jgi:hypothetical protein
MAFECTKTDCRSKVAGNNGQSFIWPGDHIIFSRKAWHE